MLDAPLLQNIAAGTALPPGTVSIILPHFETPLLARLCLRAIRRRTGVPFEVIVIDNGSADGESLDYLRRVQWIRLLERGGEGAALPAAVAHATALDLGLRAARGDLLLVMHTDTIARTDDWLQRLAAPFAADPLLAALGADKLEAPGPLGARLKRLASGKTWISGLYKLTGRAVPPHLADRPPHARSFCALYRRAALAKEGLDFVPRRMKTAGEELYHDLAARGYHVRLLPPAEMRQLVFHVVHATALLSPARTIHTGRVRRRTARRLRRLLSEPWARELLEDDALDRL